MIGFAISIFLTVAGLAGIGLYFLIGDLRHKRSKRRKAESARRLEEANR